MPKYLWQVSYTPSGLQGLLAEGGTARREVVEKLVADAGGTIEAFYFAFGSDDVVIITDLPDNQTAAAISLHVTGAGGANVRTTPLLTPEEIDRATRTDVTYRPPGK